MIENWKIEMVKEVNRIVHDTSIPPAARQDGIYQVHQWYRLARHVSTSQLNAIEPTEDSVEKWLTGVVVPSFPEQDEASDQVHIPDCHCRACTKMTHVQKTQLMGLTLSFLQNPSAANKPRGHEARLIAVAEACKTNGLSNDVTLMVLASVEPIEMYRAHFTKPGQKRWLSDEDGERSARDEGQRSKQRSGRA